MVRTYLQSEAREIDRKIFKLKGRLEHYSKYTNDPLLKELSDVLQNSRYLVRKYMHTQDIEDTRDD